MSKVRARLAADPKPLIIAHRGDWSGAPENSRAAIRAARAFDMVEIDVQLSSDGVPVVMHDPTTLRTTGENAKVSALTAAEITALKLQDSAETVPTLVQALEAGGPELLFDLDVKRPSELNAVADILARRPERDRCVLKIDVDTEDDIATLLGLERRASACVFAKHIVRDRKSLDLLQALKSKGIAAAEIAFPNLETLQDCARLGPPLTTYTLRDVHCAGLSDDAALADPHRVWGALRAAGAAGIMTDQPTELSAYFSKYSAQG